MGLGLPEIIFIMVIALLIFGPKRLPEISRTLGKGMAEFRKATNDLKNTISTELTVEDEQPARPRRVDLASVAPLVGSPAPRPLPAETVPQEGLPAPSGPTEGPEIAALPEPTPPLALPFGSYTGPAGSTSPAAVPEAPSPAAVPAPDPIEPS